MSFNDLERGESSQPLIRGVPGMWYSKCSVSPATCLAGAVYEAIMKALPDLNIGV